MIWQDLGFVLIHHGQSDLCNAEVLRNYLCPTEHQDLADSARPAPGCWGYLALLQCCILHDPRRHIVSVWCTAVITGSREHPPDSSTIKLYVSLWDYQVNCKVILCHQANNHFCMVMVPEHANKFFSHRVVGGLLPLALTGPTCYLFSIKYSEKMRRQDIWDVVLKEMHLLPYWLGYSFPWSKM